MKFFIITYRGSHYQISACNIIDALHMFLKGKGVFDTRNRFLITKIEEEEV